MAKRKRLTPAQPNYLSAAPETKAAPLGLNTAPIAQVAGEASATAALAEVTDALQSARAEGRMIELLPLEAIDEHYLVRDRLEQNEEEMAALIESLRSRGQQMPIEVVALPDPVEGKAYGLISGWRRLTALRRLFKETSDPKFTQARAIVVAPKTAQDAYVAMVEENEIRVNLSHYERARIAVKAMKEGVYPTQKAALQGLFGNVTRSKRSKIGTFIGLVEAFDDVLWFPSAISEKLGLALARELGRDSKFADVLRQTIGNASYDSAEEELQLLSSAIVEHATPAIPAKPRLRHSGANSEQGEVVVSQISDGLVLKFVVDQCRIELVGSAVSNQFADALCAWLRSSR